MSKERLAAADASVSLMTKNRCLSLQGAYNVRDLGGYPAAAGRKVISRTVFRSGDLNQLTDKDVACLNKHNIRTIVDFRTSGEIARAPHRTVPTVKRVKELPIGFGNMSAVDEVTEETAPLIMLEINRKLVADAREQFREFFGVLASASNLPVLFNCSAGKDRTGLAAALFLSSLGVEREVVFEDYLLSAECLRNKYAAHVAANPTHEALYTVRRDYLAAAFDIIDAEYGGMEAYLREQLGVDMTRMQEMFTE